MQEKYMKTVKIRYNNIYRQNLWYVMNNGITESIWFTYPEAVEASVKPTKEEEIFNSFIA